MNMTPIVFASDAMFVEQLKTASFSAVYACRHGGPGLDIHILDCGIDKATWEGYVADIEAFAIRNKVEIKVSRHDIDMSRFDNCPGWTNGSKATWARLLLPEILLDVDCCVYSDCDMLFVSNPCSIVDALRSTGFLLVGHRNPYGNIGPDGKWFRAKQLPYNSETYLCAGLIGIDLKPLREQDFVNKAFAFLREYPKPISMDQTVLNWFCHGKTSVLDVGWGLFPHEVFSYDGEIKALHYSGGYPWARVKNAYDWVGGHCSSRETRLLNDFRERVMKCNPFIRPSCEIKHRIVGWSILQFTRLLNAFRISLPGHPCFSEMIRMYDGKGSSLQKAERELFA